MASKAKFIGVSAVEISSNVKIGTVSATYAAQKTCPSSCPFMGSGCYAENGNVGFQTNRLNKQVSDVSAQRIAEEEAAAIGTLTGRFPLRLHVVGDCSTDDAARAVSAAASDYRARHGQTVWSYTHAWKDVARESWRDVSILASCETIADTKLAMARGYGAAVVAAKHADTKAYNVDGVKIIPCPQQTGRAANCESCKLCFNADKLRGMNAVIQFETHGNTKRANSALLNVLQ